MEFDVGTFIEDVQQYKQNRTEGISLKLQRYLQALCASSDKNVLDPNTNSGEKFFNSLYELMTMIEPNSSLMWSAVETLEEAIKNPAAQHTPTHKFEFTPIYTELLKNCTTNDRRIQVLRLLQSCTYGIKIQGEEAYLETLVSLLIKWTTCSKIMNRNIVSLSLGVLINLCFYNPPAINMIQRIFEKYSIDDLNLFKTVLAQHKNNLNIRVKVCRLLWFLRETQRKLLPGGIFLEIKCILRSLQESFQSSSSAIKHTDDNSRDKQNNANFKKISIYQRFTQDIDILIQLLGNISPGFVMKCTGHLLVFLQLLIDFVSPEKELGYYRIIKMALTLAGVDTRISRFTLHLVQAIIIFTNLKSQIGSKNDLLDVLEEYLKEVLSLMADRAKSLSEYKNWIVDLLSLLLECRNTSLLKTISSFFNVSVMNDMFIKDSCWSFKNIFDSSLNALYIKSFGLVLSFSKTSQAWNNLLNDLKGSKKLQTRFAAVLGYSGEIEIKFLAWELMQQMKDSRFYKNVMHAYKSKSLIVLYLKSKFRHVLKCGL